jgi:hypothetical protein
MAPDRYGADVLRSPRRRPAPPPDVPAELGLVVECVASGFCGAVLGTEKTIDGVAVRLEDRHGAQRVLPLEPGAFLIEGARVTLVRPAAPLPPPTPDRSVSGSIFLADAAPQVARASRIWVEGIHDAELVERVWGHDLRVAGIVVEPMHGADHLVDALRAFGPGPSRRVGVLLDHLVPGSKESRVADRARDVFAPSVAVVGHPFVDVWQAVKPSVLGISGWPEVPPGRPWKQGVIDALGWRCDEREAWGRILGAVRQYTDLEPALLGRVEELIDFVTEPG